MTELPLDAAMRADEGMIESVESELKVALMFVQISSAAYSTGKLQHGGDARSKAEAAHARAVAHLLESPERVPDPAVESMLKEVQSALSSLPSSAKPGMWMRRAAG